MRDVEWGWLIRYVHSTGASAFFIVVYLHMFRGLLYGSYRKPRGVIWSFGLAVVSVPKGRGVHGLPAAMGPDVVLGRAGHHQSVRGDSVHRAGPGRVDPRRLRDFGRHAAPRFVVASDRAAAGACQ